MEAAIITSLRFSYYGKRYNIVMSSLYAAPAVVMIKLRIEHIRVWLIFNNNTWRFVSDMPVCPELKTKLIRKVAIRLGGCNVPFKSNIIIMNSLIASKIKVNVIHPGSSLNDPIA